MNDEPEVLDVRKPFAHESLINTRSAQQIARAIKGRIALAAAGAEVADRIR